MRILILIITQTLFCNVAMAIFDHHDAANRGRDSVVQTDMIDIIQRLAGKKKDSTAQKSSHKLEVSVIPTLGYTLSTGFAIGASSIFTFHTQPNHDYNISVINAQAFYDSHSQETFFTQANIWMHNDDYKLVTDWRAVNYPRCNLRAWVT